MFFEAGIIRVLRNYFQDSFNGLNESSILVHPIKTGLIHKSYRVITPEGDWLLQQINSDVFRDLAGLMRNIELVTEKLAVEFQGSQYETLTLKKTISGETHIIIDGEAWRMYDFKAHLESHNAPVDHRMVHEAGMAFASFTESLSGLNPEMLSITIPKFHSLGYRYEQYQQAKQNSTSNTNELISIFEKIDLYVQELSVLEDAINLGRIPIRITHNDSKFNNLLFDSDGNARCVVDLDTVMPGIIHFDIGDCLRTMLPSIPEDSSDLDSLRLNRDYEREFMAGYLEVAEPWITDAERELLPLSGPYMSLIMGVRFLTDYLSGNVYFSCEYPEHNLVRAQNQIAVVGEWRVGSRKWVVGSG